MLSSSAQAASSFTGRRRWSFLAFLFALPTVAMLIVVLGGLWGTAPDDAEHLSRYVLPRVIPNTLSLLVLVVVASSVLGTAAAALIEFCEFAGRRVLQVLLLLPLSFPGYVLAFIYLGLFDFTGPIQTMVREQFGVSLAGRVGTLPSVVFVLTLALYPYVYMLARAGFASQGRRAFEVASSCGVPPMQAFRRAVLPLSLPWIAAGAMLVAMETLADFGAVSVFNYDTFTTAIYKTWFGLFSLQGALRLASLLLIIVAVLVVIERFFAVRRRRTTPFGAPTRFPLTRGRALGAIAFLGLLVLAGVLVPFVQLIVWSFGDGIGEWGSNYWSLIRSSLVLGGASAVCIVAAAFMLSFAQRRHPNIVTRLATRIAGLGYALPGTILAVGLFIAVTKTGDAVTGVLGESPVIRSVFGAGLVVTFLAYLVRFTAVALSALENGFLRVPPSLDDASRQLGRDGVGLLWFVHRPLLRSSGLAAMLLVFVDVLKEMPITLMTRPFGWDTLAVRVFERTAEAQWAEAAPAALLIVVVGLLPVMVLTKNVSYAAYDS
ncbi:MAG: iron ABC transporter permease [Pseudomonadota bacterium]